MPTASKTAFVADTTLGLSPEEALEKGIHLVPVQAIHGGRSYRDLLEIGPEEVLALLEKGERLSTSQAAPEDLRATYERLLLDHDRVLSVHLSGKLSGTVATAQAVARAYGSRVQVLDSWSLNGGLGIARFVGGLLRILPVLLVRDGQVEAGPRVRGFIEGMHKMAELFRKDFPEGALVHLAHAGNPEGARALGELLRAEGVQILSTLQAGAAVGVHAGPGTIAFFAGHRR